MGMFGWLKSFFQESESVPQEKVVKMPEAKKLQKQEMARIFEEKYPMYVMDVEDLQELPMITFASGLRVNLADRSIAQKIANIPEGASVRICQKDDGGLDVGYFPESYARVMDPRSLDIDMGVQANGSRYYQLRTYGGIRIDSPEAVEVRDNYVEELSRKRALRAQRKEGTEALKNVEERTPKVEFVHNETRNLDEANLPKIRMGNTELDLQSFADVFSKLPVGGEIVIGRRDLKESPEKDNVEFGLSQDGKMKIMLSGLDSKVSRQHMVICRDEKGQLVMRDTSTNGTRLVERQKIEPAAVKSKEANLSEPEDKFLPPQRMERGKSYDIDEKNLPKMLVGHVPLDLKNFAKDIAALGKGEELIIGRDEGKSERGIDCRIAANGVKMIALDNGKNFVSRRHAILRRDKDGKLQLMDISTNGTYLVQRQEKESVVAKSKEANLAKVARIYHNPRDGR